MHKNSLAANQARIKCNISTLSTSLTSSFSPHILRMYFVCVPTAAAAFCLAQTHVRQVSISPLCLLQSGHTHTHTRYYHAWFGYTG